MRRILTLVCAITIAICSSIASPLSDNGKGHEGFSSSILQNVAKITPIKYPKAFAPTSSAKALGHRSASETYTFNAATLTERYVSFIGAYQVTLGDEGQGLTQFSFYINLPEGETDLTDGVTYTYDQMNAMFTLGLYENREVEIAAVGLVRTHDASDDHVIFNATVTDVKGNTYTIVYEEPAHPIDYDTIDIVINDPATVRMSDVVATQGAVQFLGKNEQYDIYAAFYTTNLVGPCGDIMLDASGIFDVNTGAPIATIHDGKAEVSQPTPGTYVMEAYFYSEEAHCYHITFTFVTPTPETIVDFKSTNLMIDAGNFDLYKSILGYGMFTITASNVDYSLNISATSYDHISGDYAELHTEKNNLVGSIIRTADSKTYEIYKIVNTIHLDNEALTLTGSVLCYGNVQFDMNFSCLPPEPNDTINLEIVDGILRIAGGVNGFPRNSQFFGFTEDKSRKLTIAFYGDLTPGTYTEQDNPYPNYNYVADIVNGQEIERYEAISFNIDVTDNGDGTYDMVGKMFTQAMVDRMKTPIFIITMKNLKVFVEKALLPFDAQEQDYSEKFTLDQVVVDSDNLASDSIVVIEAINDNNAIISLALNTADGLATGQYKINNSYDLGTFIASIGLVNNYIYPSFAGYLDSDGNLTDPFWFMVNGTVTVEMDGDKLKSIVVDALNSYDQKIYIEIKDDQDSIDTIMEEIKAIKILRDGQLIILHGGKEYNAQGISL